MTKEESHRLFSKEFKLKIARDNVDTDELALLLFRHQREYNPVYKEWLQVTQRYELEPEVVENIPFLPILFFKTRAVTCLPGIEPTVTFQSSRTTGQIPSNHLIFSLDDYLQNAERIWTRRFGALRNYCFLALLPRYTDNPNSSLLAMVNHFMTKSGNQSLGGYVSPNQDPLLEVQNILNAGLKPVLFGVTFALLALAETRHSNAPFMIIETGGMKGTGKEITREELRLQLQKAFPNTEIYSEYGMTELLSQAYTNTPSSEWFSPPSTLRFLLRNARDPFETFTPLTTHKVGEEDGASARGLLNIIDLANVDTCAFIATDDLAEKNVDGSVRILGRMDNSEIRGCNLLVQ